MRIEDLSAREIFDQLIDIDETDNVEAKSLVGDTTRSILETVNSFSNEPGLGGGVILIGIGENDDPEGPRYVIEGAKELAGIKDQGLMVQKGRARGTYYVPVGLPLAQVDLLHFRQKDVGDMPQRLTAEGYDS